MKNPFYCGILSHNILEGKVVEGNHEKLITKKLFLQANETKKGNTGGYKISIPNDEIPLKRFLKCETCGCFMRGYKAYKNQKHYYKCGTKGCSNNMRADAVHVEFKKKLKEYQISVNDGMDLIIKKYMEHTYRQLHKDTDTEKELLEKQIKDINKKMERLEERFIGEEIEKEMFTKYNELFKIEKREIQKKMELLPKKSSNLENCIEKAIKLSTKLNTVWDSADYLEKQKLQYLVFPNGMSFDKKNMECRTERVNSIFSAIADIAKVTNSSKKDNSDLGSELSMWVEPAGIEPASKHILQTLSTCLFSDCLSGRSRTETYLPLS